MSHARAGGTPMLAGRSALLLLWLLLPCGSIAAAQAFQSWNEVDLTTSWRRVDFLVPLAARTDSALPNPQLAATGVTADLHLPRKLTLTPGYLFADLPQASYHVHLPLLALTWSWHSKGFTMADRNRIEKLIGYPTSPVRYRNRLLLDFAIRPKERAHAFVDDEVFVNLTAGNFNQNRLQAGGGVRLSRHLLLDIYYLQKNPPHGATTNVLGSTLRIILPRLTPRIIATQNP